MLPKKKEKDEGTAEEFIEEVPKFVTLNQLPIKISGATDRLLVVRDVTSIVMNEQIMDAKKEMAKLTDHLMGQVNDYTKVTEKKLEQLDVFVLGNAGKELIEESHSEVKKMQFKLKDF